MEKFVDTQFPANDSVLPEIKRNTGVIWKRPSELSSQVSLFNQETARGSDPQQGDLGDCWLVSSLALIAGSGNNRIGKLFVESNFEQGKHRIQFYKNFVWKTIEIDDLIPCASTGDILFARNSAGGFWVPLIEKAYAKLYNGYQHIEAGLIADGLSDLTGEGVEVMQLSEYVKNQSDGIADLWSLMKYNSDQKFPMGCTISSSESKTDLNGLVINHAYSITLCKEFNGNKLVRISNPWGETEWTGAWSDGADDWKPDILELVGHKFVDDGVFFMALNDFIARFNIIYVLRLTADDVGGWTKQSVKGEWKGNRAGGHENWLSNPQYSVSTQDSDNKIVVCLSQPDQRATGAQFHEIGMIVLQTNGRKLATRYCARRNLSYEFKAHRGESYIVIPLTYDANVEAPFELSVYSLFPIKIQEIPSTELIFSEDGETIDGVWYGETAGGSAAHDSFVSNPQFNFTATKSDKLSISLEQYGTTDSIGAFVVEVPKAGVRLDTDFEDEDTKFFADVSIQAIRGYFEVVTGKIYTVVPFTFRPAREGRFRLSVLGVKLLPIP